MVCICCKCAGCGSAVHRKHVVKFAAVSRALYSVHSVTFICKALFFYPNLVLSDAHRHGYPQIEQAQPPATLARCSN